MTTSILDKFTKVSWKPNSHAQEAALRAYLVGEVLLAGDRGGGKSATLLMLFAMWTDQGFGADWRGVIFRKSRASLEDIVNQSKKFFNEVYPSAKFNKTELQWEFPQGETLKFTYFETPDDYWRFHGQEIPFIGWEEITAYTTDECYLSMFSCNRSSNPKVPRMIRATTNPFGPGKRWVRQRWQLPNLYNRVVRKLVDENGDPLPDRLAIKFRFQDNTNLKEADPQYLSKIRASAANDPEKLKAWIAGDWTAEGFTLFAGQIRKAHQLIPFKIPRSWRMDRSFDWGSAKPFSYNLWAQSDGSPYTTPNGHTVETIKGDVFHIAELYGWSGKPNVGSRLSPEQQAQAIKGFEETLGIYGKVKAGPAGIDLFATARGEPMSVSYAKKSIHFTKAYVAPGSRVAGIERIKTMLFNADPLVIDDLGRYTDQKLMRENPGLFFFTGSRSAHLLRVLNDAEPDPKNPDDTPADYEDHPIDSLRYRLLTKTRNASQESMSGDEA